MKALVSEFMLGSKHQIKGSSGKKKKEFLFIMYGQHTGIPLPRSVNLDNNGKILFSLLK